MEQARHLTTDELEQGLEDILRSPRDEGVVRMLARRPETDAREVVEEAALSHEEGVVGDRWSHPRPGKTPEVERQLTLMNARTIALIAGHRERWSLAGDQFFVDLDLSDANLPPGTQLAVGGAVIEVTEPPHTGCKKFVQRFGKDAMLFVNSPRGRELNLRGVNARVIQPGVVRTNDMIRKL